MAPLCATTLTRSCAFRYPSGIFTFTKGEQNGAGTVCKKYILLTPLKLKKENGVIIFDTKKKQGSSSSRFFSDFQTLWGNRLDCIAVAFASALASGNVE
jgi:hypothetical protein